MCCVTIWCCCFAFKYIKKLKQLYPFTFIPVNPPVPMSSAQLTMPSIQAPIIHLRRQITRTTAETMESSWFYWLELSCQRYWVFIHSISQLVCDQTSSDIHLLKHLWTQGDAGKKQETRSLLKTAAKKPMHPSSRSRADLTPCNAGAPASPRKLPFCREVSIREQEAESRRLRKRGGEEEGAGLARAHKLRHRGSPIWHRNTFCITVCTR